MSEKRIRVWVQAFKDREHLVLQWHDPDTGKRKSKSAETADPEKAEAARVDLEADLNNGRYAEASRMTWERFRELFEVEYVAAKRLNTRRNYAATLDLFEKICSPRHLKGITERTVSAYAAGLRKEPGRRKGTDSMMPSSIKVRLQFLHTVLKWAVDQKMLAAVPRFPTVRVPKKDPQPVAVEAFERMLAKADANMRAYLLTGWLAGLRLSEAYELEWEPADAAPYLDLARSRIVLPAEFVKAVKDQWLPLDAELRQVLEALPRHGSRVFRFVNSRGVPLTANGVSQRVIKLAGKAGVRLTMKALRRGFGCRYAGKVSAHVLQRLMRHASIKTTMDYYANIDQAVEEAVLGDRRNTLRNTEGQAPEAGAGQDDASPCSDGLSSS
jgi:integrase